MSLNGALRLLRNPLWRLRAAANGPDVFEGSDEALIAAPPAVSLGTVRRRFWRFVEPYRWWFAAVIAFVAASAALDAATVWMYKLLVDDVLVPQNFPAFWPIAAAYIGLTTAAGGLSFVRSYLSAWMSHRVVLALRTDVFAHLAGLSPGFFEQRRLGDLMTRVTADARSIEQLLLSEVQSVIADCFKILFYTGALFYLRWELALASLVVVPPFWLIARYFSKRIRAASRERRRRSGSLGTLAEETLSNVAAVQGNNRERYEVERFHRQGVGNLVARMVATRLKALLRPLVTLLDLAGTMLVVGLGIWAVAHGQLSIGGMLVFLAYLSKLYRPIRRLTRILNRFQSAAAGAERVIELLDQKPAVREAAAAKPLQQSRGTVALERVGFSYPGREQAALRDVSLQVNPGESLALIGPSGAGKSTIGKLLLRFYDPCAGRILLDGHDIRDLTLRSLRANVTLLPQEASLFDGTIRDNIAYGKPEATEAQIVAAATAADIHQLIVSLPDEYETTVGQKGRLLSGGQRQRVAIARALLRDTPVLILDEPTTGLDVQSAERILRPLRDLMVGRTTIIVSHHLPLLTDVTHVAVMDGGRVIEQGRREQMEDGGGGYADLCRLYLQLANGSAASARGAAAETEARGPDIASSGVGAEVAGGV